MIQKMKELLLLLPFLFMGKKASSSSSSSSGPSSPSSPPAAFPDAWRKRVGELASRGRSGVRWAPLMAARLGSPEAGAAAARWIGIESGGNPLAASSLNERGLTQAMHGSIKELGLTEDDWRAMADKATSDARHADIAAQAIRGQLDITRRNGTPGVSPGWGPPLMVGDKLTVNGIGVAKLRHGLPLLVAELRDQGHLRTTIPLTLRSALTGSIGQGTPKPVFKPSPRLAAFAKGAHAKTGNVAADLLLRFLAPAAVVAFAEDAAHWGAVNAAETVS